MITIRKRLKVSTFECKVNKIKKISREKFKFGFTKGCVSTRREVMFYAKDSAESYKLCLYSLN